MTPGEEFLEGRSIPDRFWKERIGKIKEPGEELAMEEKHTPIPWLVDAETNQRILKDKKVICHLIDDMDSLNCLMNEADLHLIVKAVNSYHENLELIKELVEALDGIMHELGVPQPGYPAPVANAFFIAREAYVKANKRLGKDNG